MPTTVTKTVKPSGGDYTSLTAWEAGEQANLVSLDQIRQAECYAMSDPGVLVVSGWTTSATQYIRIFTEPASRHAGTWDASKHRIEAAFLGVLTQQHARLEGLQIACTPTGSTARAVGIYLTVANITARVDACLVKLVDPSNHLIGWDGFGVMMLDTGQTVYMSNSVIYDWATTTVTLGFYAQQVGTAYVYNTTFQNCYIGLAMDAGTIHAKNVLAQNCGNGFHDLGAGAFHANSTNNCSDLASDAPGSNPRTGSVTFVNAGADDFHLSGSDTVAKGFGADLSADATYPFTTDIDGQTRPATWDIGADQALVAMVALTGTAAGGLTEAEVVAGGRTIILTLTDDTWIAGATAPTAGIGLGGWWWGP